MVLDHVRKLKNPYVGQRRSGMHLIWFRTCCASHPSSPPSPPPPPPLPSGATAPPAFVYQKTGGFLAVRTDAF